jgi:hypothetical protein
MKLRKLSFAGLAGLIAGGLLFFVFPGFGHPAASQGVMAPNAADLRFQLIGNEPIAGPDGLSLVKDWSVLMFKDRKSGQCHLAFSRGGAIAAVNVIACPQ